MTLLPRLLQLVREQRLAASPLAAEAANARAFAHPDWMAAYARADYLALGLHESEALLCERHLRAGDRLLDVGCGTGREAHGFARRGLRVTAIDVCPEAIAVARSAALGVTFATGSLSGLSFPDPSFDAVFIASDVYACVPGERNRVAALARCRRLLRPGGLVIVPVSFERSGLLSRALIDGPRRLLRPLLGERLPETGDRFAAGFRHVFSCERELERELEAAGLGLVDRVEGFHVASTPRRYRRRATVAVEAAGSELLLVELARGRTFKLNGTGRAILDLALAGLSAAEVAARLHESLGVTRERLEADATSLLDELAREHLVEAVP